jgi:hypothetical protein
MDAYMERAMFEQQKDSTGAVRTLDSLYHPTRDGESSGPYQGHVMKSSAYTSAMMMSPVTRALPLLAASALLAVGVRRWVQ